MKQLDKVLTNTTWAKASNTINLNNDALYVAVTALEHAAFKHKGYFKTVALLQEAYPTAEEGSQAFVYNSANPTTAPYDIYTWTNAGWQDSGVNGGNVDVNLDDKQDTLVGYSETVSNGKATQIAIEGDTIALGGKVSIGQINNLETAILLSSAQASNAETIANTIKNEVSLLKQPVKPLLLNANGKLELSIGQGLYVSDGKLCANMAAGGSGSGGGTVYSEGAGISISNNKISVAYNMETLGIDSCGGLTVNYGEGLTLKNGKLSATNTVTAGAGVSVQNGQVSLNVGTGLNLEQSTDSGGRKVYVAVGRGLEVDNENKVYAKVDGSTIVANSNGVLYVNKGVLAGYGLRVAYDKLAVNYGTGLAYDITTGKIHVNYGTGLAVSDGKLKVDAMGIVSGGGGLVSNDGVLGVNVGAGLTIDTCSVVVNYGTGLAVSGGKLYSTVQSKTYTAGNGLEMINNVISVKLATDTSNHNVSGLYISEEALSLKLGSGLVIDTQSGDAVVNIGTGLQIGDDKKLFCNVTSKTYTAGNGVAISGDAISVNYGTGLAVSGGKLYSTVTSGKNYTDGNGISISGENKISVKHGDGLKIQDTFLTIATGDGLHLAAGGVLAINPSDGLGFTSDGMLKLKLHEKSGLKVDSEGLGVNVGVALGTVDGKLNVQYGTGLSVSDNKIYVDTSKIAGEGIDLNTESKKLEIGTKAAKVLSGSGLVADGTQIKVDASITNDIASNKNKISALQTAVGKKQNWLTAGCGISLCGDVATILYGSGLTMYNHHLVVNQWDMVKSGGGLRVECDALAVQLGAGLTIESCSVVVNYGAGLSVNNNNKIYVDTSKIAGAGIDLNADNKKLEIGTQAAKALAGSGLVADGTKIKVDAANLTVGDSSKLAGKDIGNFMTYDNHHNYVSAGFTDENLSKKAAEKYIEYWDAADGWFNSTWGKVTAHSGFVGNLTGTASNASALQGYAATDVDRAIALDRSKVIDLTALQDDKWYPCTLQLVAQQLTEIRIWNYLTDESIPSWSTHRKGFSLQVVWEVTAAGWGGQETARKIHMSQYKFANAHPCGGITQNTMQSVEIVWLRGGAKYLYHTNNGENFVVHADGYSWSGSGSSFTAAVCTASQITNPIYGYSGTGSKIAASLMYADAFHGRADTATADANGDNIANCYQKKINTTYGLEMTGPSTISMPLLGAMLGGGATDGSKNGAQRVLELSCGAIQIKLSTGLAIDELGYLYVKK